MIEPKPLAQRQINKFNPLPGIQHNKPVGYPIQNCLLATLLVPQCLAIGCVELRKAVPKILAVTLNHTVPSPPNEMDSQSHNPQRKQFKAQSHVSAKLSTSPHRLQWRDREVTMDQNFQFKSAMKWSVLADWPGTLMIPSFA